MPPPKQLQQWQSGFGQDEIVNITDINESAWRPVNLEPGVIGVNVVPEATEGIKVSLDGGTTFVTLLRSIKTGAEFDFQDRFPFATRGLTRIFFQALTTAGPHTVTLIKRHEV